MGPVLSNVRQKRHPYHIFEGWHIATVYEKQGLDNDRLS